MAQGDVRLDAAMADGSFFRKCFFKDQFLMAQKCYLPRMETCDIVVDTTGAAIWATPETASVLLPARADGAAADPASGE